MPSPILTRLEGRFPLAAHEHVAALYRSRREAFRWTSFLAEGLVQNHICHYLAPRAWHEDMLRNLRAQGVEAEPYLRSGSLQFHEGVAEFGELQEQTRRAFLDAERVGAPALRWLEEGRWADAVGFPRRQFCDFHATLNYQVKHYPSIALCQYDLETTEIHLLFCAIAVHRHLIVEDTLVRDNPFYTPAEKFIPMASQDRDHELVELFREVGFDLSKLLAMLADYGRLQPGGSNP